MPIQTLLINELNSNYNLKEKLNVFCPQINVIGELKDIVEIQMFIQLEAPQLIFFDISAHSENSKIYTIINLDRKDYEVIFLIEKEHPAFSDIKKMGYRYILKPIDDKELIHCTYSAQEIIEQKIKNHHNQQMIQNLIAQNQGKRRIGIPTMKGLEFVSIDEIVRCQGLQKCTKVVLLDGSTIVSSYSIGEFHKFLKSYGFFPTHKSHLVNLIHIQRYEKDGIITMTDLSSVPVSRRKRTAFLEKLNRL